MSKIPEDLLYTEEHEYVRKTDDESVVQIGITDYAQGELGDVVYVDLPKVGASVGRMDVFGTIEAVKAVSELFAPVGGEVVEVNDAVKDHPEAVNKAVPMMFPKLRAKFGDTITYAELIDRLSKRDFEAVSPALRRNIDA